MLVLLMHNHCENLYVNDLNAASLSHAPVKQLKASVTTGLRNRAIDLEEFVLQGVRVMSNDTLFSMVQSPS